MIRVLELIILFTAVSLISVNNIAVAQNTVTCSLWREGEISGKMYGSSIDSMKIESGQLLVFFSGIDSLTQGNVPINVALNKPVTVSKSVNPAVYSKEYVVDGDITTTNDHRWLSSGNEPWIEIDLQQEHTLTGFKTWNGTKNDGYSYPVAHIRFQIWQNNSWTTVFEQTGNLDPLFEAGHYTGFNSVTTTKVRLLGGFSDTWRLFEVEVYGNKN
jgi:hypothetical protein